MKKLYTNGFVIPLLLLKAKLEEEKIDVLLEGEFPPAAGSISPIVAWPTLFVTQEKDYHRAEKILEAFLVDHENRSQVDWICVDCYSEVPGEFEFCWKCQHGKPCYQAVEEAWCAHNYAPLPVVLVRGQGIYVWDESGKRYMDMMSAYSAVSLGHAHPVVLKALMDQAQTLSIVSRAYSTSKLGPFLKRACELTGYDRALPMNSGAEAVETAIKAARKWGYQVKKVKPNQAEIIVCEGNFHGRTTTIISMSSEAQYKDGFSPLTPGFVRIPYNDSSALEKAITENTVAFLVEPIQGEAGIIVPDKGYLKRCAEICKKHNVLLICDEVQTGLGRTGKLLACFHDDVKPDAVVLGKALGGGFLPVSLFLAKQEVMAVFAPGDHGSTFGGNALSSAVGLASLNVIISLQLSQRAEELGHYFLSELKKIQHPAIKTVRGKGLLIGLEMNTGHFDAHDIALKLLEQGILTKETHHTVLRFAPPLIITKEQIDDALNIIRKVFR